MRNTRDTIFKVLIMLCNMEFIKVSLTVLLLPFGQF